MSQATLCNFMQNCYGRSISFVSFFSISTYKAFLTFLVKSQEYDTQQYEMYIIYAEDIVIH